VNKISNIQWKLEVLKQETAVNAFDCLDKDLNDFLLKDAKKYALSMLATTYFVNEGDNIIAYFCLSNDRITKDETLGRSQWNKLNRVVANEKRRKSYPAVKIGRLAVSNKYANFGFGTLIIRIIKEMYAHSKQQAGCRFVTVDAYQNALGFYQKNGFDFLTEKDEQAETRVMYLDLKAFG
jgi:predicted GNAT family N-acyltransferase